ncbi:MAG TPA: PKD domain-containing protein [Cyclobacteriaceae bacterium]|nr:PKD domain-containing protein [Cyclobacteriaceae bacterium]
MEARDINQLIDLEHNFEANLSAPNAAISPTSINFIEGILSLENVQYNSAGEGTILVTSNGLSSAAPSISSTRVDVLHVSASLATGGVTTSTNLPGGALSRVIFGFTFNTPYSISNEPLLERFTINFSNPITGIFNDIRIFESKITSYSAANAVNVVNPAIGAQLTIGANFITVDFSNNPRDLSDPENASLSYFLMVSVSDAATSNTPSITPRLIDLGYTDPDTNNNIIISNGSSLADLSGLTYSFASIFPPTLVSSEPFSGQLNVDPNQTEIALRFSVPVLSMDRKIRLHDKDAGTFVELDAIDGITEVINPIRFAIPPGTMEPDKVYFITIAPGSTSNNTGIRDDADNLFPGISFSGTLFFKTANPNPPIMLTATTPGISNPSISNITVSGAVINATFDQRGKAYFLVLPSGSPAPSNEQIAGTLAYPGFIDRGSFDINQTNPISQFGVINADLSTSTSYNVWLYAENDALPAPIPTPAPYGSLANNHVAGTPGPTFTFTTPATVSTNITLNVPNVNICSNSMQLLNAPIIISEGNMGNFNTNGNVVTFNLLLPAGFEFDISLSDGKPVYGDLKLFGADFNVAQPTTPLSFIGSGILRVQYANNGSSSRDQIIISGLRIRGNSSAGGSLVRLGGDALSGIADLTSFLNISSSDAQGIVFTNSYTEFVFPGQPVVTFIPDNFNAPNFNVELTPLPPPGDYGVSTFSGQGININILNLSAVTLDQPFNITVTHTDNNGCVSTAFEQYTVYDHRTAIPDLAVLYCAVNENFPAAANLGTNPRLIRYNTRPTYYLFDLKTDIPLSATASSQIMFGDLWRDVLQSLAYTVGGPQDAPDDPSQGALQYFNYEWDEAIILNFSDPANNRPTPYHYFREVSPQGNEFFRGGSLGFVEFSGRFQNIANSALQIPLTQNVEIFIPAVPIVEVGTTNLANASLNNNVFCQSGGNIAINGYPAATAGVSVGKFRLYDAATDVLITENNTNYFIDNGNGSAILNPSLFQNAYAAIRIEYTYKDNNSPCESTGNFTIQIAPNPVANFVMRSNIDPAITPFETSYCEDEPIEFSAETSSIAIGSITSYQWDFGDATNSTFANPNTVSGTIADGFDRVNHTYIQSAVYNPSLRVSSALGCSSVVQANELKVGIIPDAAFEFEGVSVADAISFSNQTNVPAGAVDDGIAALLWTYGDGNNASITSAFNDPVTNNYASAGQYIANLEVTSIIGCRSTAGKLVIVLPKFTPDANNAYLEDFESNNGGWQHNTTPNSAAGGSSWAHGTVSKTTMQLNPEINGTQVWATALSGTYNPRERSALYSPSFDISNLNRPMVSFNSFVHMDVSDGVIIQYSVDNKNVADPTKVWHVLGNQIGGGVDWFNEQGVAAKPGDQVTRDFAWTGIPGLVAVNGTSAIRWLDSKHAITNDPEGIKDDIIGASNVVFRFALAGSRDEITRDGFAIDNFRIGNRTRTVLIENFTNTSQANNTANEATYLQNFDTGSNEVELVKINYHVNFPGPDPFNQMNPNDPGARALYYGISQTPRARLDGETAETNVNPLFSGWGALRFSQQTLQSAEANISLEAVNNDGQLQITVRVIPVVDLPAGTVMQLAILEEQISLSDIGISNVPSGQTDFEYVLKRMLPNAAGSKSNVVLPANVEVVYGPFNYNPGSTQLDLVAVAFLQNESSRQVYQAEILKANINQLDLITGVEKTLMDNNKLSFYPNPANKVLNIQFAEVLAEPVRINLMDQMGKMLQQSGIDAGGRAVQLDTENYAAGLYFIQLESASGTITRQKIIIVH